MDDEFDMLARGLDIKTDDESPIDGDKKSGKPRKERAVAWKKKREVNLSVTEEKDLRSKRFFYMTDEEHRSLRLTSFIVGKSMSACVREALKLYIADVLKHVSSDEGMRSRAMMISDILSK